MSHSAGMRVVSREERVVAELTEAVSSAALRAVLAEHLGRLPEPCRQVVPYDQRAVSWAEDLRCHLTETVCKRQILRPFRNEAGVALRKVHHELTHSHIKNKQKKKVLLHEHKRRTARGVSFLWCVWSGGQGEGYPCPVRGEGGWGYPCPRTWLGYPLPPATGLTTGLTGVPPEKGPVTRDWGTPPVDKQTPVKTWPSRCTTYVGIQNTSHSILTCQTIKE